MSRLRKLLAITLFFVIALSSVAGSAAGIHDDEDASMFFVRTGELNTYMLNIEYHMSYNNYADRISYLVNQGDTIYKELDTGYICEVEFTPEDNDDYSSGFTLNGTANAYFDQTLTITFSDSVSFPDYGGYYITAAIKGPEGRVRMSIGTYFENRPVCEEIFLGPDEEYDPDIYETWQSYAFSFMNMVNAIREKNDIRRLSFNDDSMDLAEYRLYDFAYCNIKSRRGLDTAYEIMEIRPQIYFEQFAQGAASPAELLALMLSDENCKDELLYSEDYRRIGVSCGIKPDGICFWSVELYK